MLPLTPFDGHTKRFTRDMLDPAQGAMVDWFFPDFFRKKTDDELRAERERPPLRDADYIARNPDPPRRYAPYFLPRERYRAVARGPDGDDGGTMSREMLAYRNPGTDCALDIWDCATLAPDDLPAGLQSAYPGPGPRMLLIVWHAADAELPEIAVGAREQEGIIAFEVPYRVEEMSIERVLDLRHPETQEWFHEYFLHYWGMRVFEHEAYPLPRSFSEMLPVLMDPTLGGNETTKAIGEWLVGQGVGALIYPSARSNAAVHLQDGALESAFGWCLLDLRELRPLATEAIHVGDPWDLSERTAFPLYTIAGGPNHGSWWVQGPQEHLERSVKEPFRQRLAAAGAG
jgi:hypothetical protein